MRNNNKSLPLAYLRWTTIVLFFLQWSNWTWRLSPIAPVGEKTGQFDTLLDPRAGLRLRLCDRGGKRLDVVQIQAK